MHIDYLLTLAALAALLSALVALFGICCAVNRMQATVVRPPIAVAYFLIGCGWFTVIVAMIDYLAHLAPFFWPWLLVGGVALLALGNAVLFLADRRKRCDECRMRRCGGGKCEVAK